MDWCSANKGALLKNKDALLLDNEGLLTEIGPSLPSDADKTFR